MENRFLSARSNDNWKETETLQLFLNLERHAIKSTAGPSTPPPVSRRCQICFWPKGLKKWGGLSHWRLFFRFSMEMKYFSFLLPFRLEIIDKIFQSKLFCISYKFNVLFCSFINYKFILIKYFKLNLVI